MKTRKGEPVIVVPEEQQQIVELERELAERDRRIGELEAELRRWRGCPSCKEDHDDSVMCPPHEVRTSGRAWFHTQARKWAERAEELQVERDELQRKLDACQCESRVLNESMLIEAKQERDQALAESGLLREALIWASAADDFSPGGEGGFLPGKAREGFEKIVLPALAATPHAAKAAERVRKLKAVAEIATRAANTWREYPPFTFDEMDELRAALDALDKPEVQEWKCPNPNCINGAEDTGGVTPWDEPILVPCPACQDRKRNTAAYTERVKAMADVVKEARHFYGHYGPLNDALDRLDALDKPEVQG